MRLRIFFLVPLLLLAQQTAPAQSGSVDFRATGGYTTFLDESSQAHLFTGASFRYYFTPRLAIEPEAVFLYKDSTHHDYGAGVNLSFDFRDPSSQVRPYVIGGVGVLRAVFPRFSDTGAMYSGGVGSKFYVSRGWFVAPEARIGFEPIVRLTFSLGYTWGRE